MSFVKEVIVGVLATVFVDFFVPVILLRGSSVVLEMWQLILIVLCASAVSVLIGASLMLVKRKWACSVSRNHAISMDVENHAQNVDSSNGNAASVSGNAVARDLTINQTVIDKSPKWEEF